MATNTVNNFVRASAGGGTQAATTDLTVSNPQVSGGFVSSIPAAAALGAIIAGDMVYLTSNYALASLSTSGSANANAANFVGVATDTYPLVFTDQIVGGFPVGTPAKIQYRIDGYFRFHTTSGDTYHPGDTVYLGADGQTVQKTSSGTAIGVVGGDQRVVGVQIGSNVTGAAAQDVVVRIAPAVKL
jgi:hypothetical protein